MTPKEKAEELVQYHYTKINVFTSIKKSDYLRAKVISINLCDEILNARETVNKHVNQYCESNLWEFMQYWKEVKQEIEAL